MADQKSSPPHFAIKNKVSSKAGLGKRAAIYTRISTGDQHAETQLYDPVNWRSSADLTSSTHTLTPFLAQNRNAQVSTSFFQDARRHRFDVVMVAAFDRLARNVRHSLEVPDLRSG